MFHLKKYKYLKKKINKIIIKISINNINFNIFYTVVLQERFLFLPLIYNDDIPVYNYYIIEKHISKIYLLIHVIKIKLF